MFRVFFKFHHCYVCEKVYFPSQFLNMLYKATQRTLQIFSYQSTIGTWLRRLYSNRFLIFHHSLKGERISTFRHFIFSTNSYAFAATQQSCKNKWDKYLKNLFINIQICGVTLMGWHQFGAPFILVWLENAFVHMGTYKYWRAVSIYRTYPATFDWIRV